MPLKPSAISAPRERGQELLGCPPSRQEVLLGEVQAGRHAVLGHLLGANLGQLLQVHGHGAVGVGADADPVAVLAVVEVLVLVAQDGQPGAVGVSSGSLRPIELRARAVVLTYWWASGSSGTDMPDHRADLGAPEAGAGDHDVRRDHAVGRLDAGDSAAGLLDAGHGGGTEERDAGCAVRFDQQLDGAGRGGQAVGGDVEAAEDLSSWVEQRVVLARTRRGR